MIFSHFNVDYLSDTQILRKWQENKIKNKLRKEVQVKAFERYIQSISDLKVVVNNFYK